ncbi:MAG: hypothetical protein LCH93_07055 [Proteobacteria bacterium]|nr:hypothetical protein [Pseudomonadota bacterium]
MAHVVKLRVKDTTTSTGTGAKVLARSTLLNFRTFDAVMANGDTCDAIVVNRSANQWEHSSWTIAGVGGEPVLTRLEFKESSTGTPVHFTEGVKDVLMLYPVAGTWDLTARTLKLAPNIIDGTPGSVSAFRFYDDGDGWIAGIGISSASVDIRSGWNVNLWSGQTGNLRNTVRINQNGLSVAVGAAVATGIEPAAALHVVNHGGAPSAIITTSTNTAVRIGPNGVTSAIEGVDYTGLAAWRPLFVNGEEVLIGTNGVERMRVKWDGAVSIGTTVAGAKFHVQGAGFNGGNGYFVSTDSANSIAIKGTNGAAIYDSAYVALMDGTRTIYLGLAGTAAGGDVGRFRIIGANGQENFSIGTTGNVGIGVSAPGAALEVAGDILLANNKAYKIRTAGGSMATLLNIDGSDTTRFYAPGSLHINPDSTGSTYLNYNSSGSVFVGSGVTTTKFVVGKGYVGFGTGSPNANLSFGTSAGLNGLYLYDDGNAGATGFGISPNTLNIFANALSTTSAAIAFGSYDKTTFTEWARIVNGRMGVGISSPQFKLHIKTLDGAPQPLLVAGTTIGVRIVTSSVEAAIESADATGVVSYQPMVIKGSTVKLRASSDKLFVNDNGVGIGDWCDTSFNLQIKSSLSTKIRQITTGTANQAAEYYQEVGGRGAYRGVNYNGNYLHEYGYAGIATRYSDFDNHLFRTGGGADRLIVNTTGVGIGMAPVAILSVMGLTVSTGFTTLADFHVPNTTGGATHSRFSIMQLGVNSMGLEVANQVNGKGYLGLQPYGGLVTVGPYLKTGDPFSVQLDYDGHLNSTIYNHSIGNSAAAKFNMTVRDRHVSRMLYYKDQWMQEKGIGVTQFYSEFDVHTWRNNAGADKMSINVGCHLWLANTADPGTPSIGGYIYISGGALKYRGSGGTITTLAPA